MNQRATGTNDMYVDVQVELTRLIFDEAFATVMVGCLGVTGTVALLAQHYGDPRLTFLAWALLATSVPRVGVILAFTRRGHAKLTAKIAARWEFAYFLTSLLYFFVLSAASFCNFRFHDAVSWNLSTLALFMISFAFSSRLGMRPWMVNVSCIVLFLPLLYSTMRSQQMFSGLAAFLTCLFSFSMMKSIGKKHATVVDQVRSQHKLRELTQRDALTGLANRRYFEERLELAFQRRKLFAVLFIDLDRFKAVNDTYGHAAGDSLLRSVADRLRAAVREGDLTSRLGGDEFAILQTSIVTATSAEELATRINRTLSTPFLIEDHEVSIGASIGIRLSTAKDGTTQSLLELADQALYQVKKAGGGSFAIADAAAPSPEDARALQTSSH